MKCLSLLLISVFATAAYAAPTPCGGGCSPGKSPGCQSELSDGRGAGFGNDDGCQRKKCAGNDHTGATSCCPCKGSGGCKGVGSCGPCQQQQQSRPSCGECECDAPQSGDDGCGCSK